jgi:CubicO group peptidase (beta-lactamase class C family)
VAAADEMDDYVRGEMETQHIPGLEFAVLKDGHFARAGAYGVASVELNAPVTSDTRFAIASMTKPIVASAIMLLVQDGKLTLDDPVTKFIPGLPESWKVITIRHLLSHTSGIKDRYQDYPFFPKLDLNGRLDYTDQEFVRALVKGGLNFPPGKQWAYTGSGYALLGMVISKVTGQPYAEFLRMRIFAPLGMTRTRLINPPDIIPQRAAGYDWEKGKLINAGYSSKSFLGLADTSLLSTATDLTKWLDALEHPKLWTSSSVEQMWTPTKLSDGRELAAFPSGSYGLGWDIGLYKSYKVMGHSGGLPGFSSIMFYLPEQHLFLVVLDNQWEANPARIAFGLAGLIDPALTPPHRMKPISDPQPALTVKAKGFLNAFFGGGDATTFITPGLHDHLHPVPKPPQKPPPIEPAYIASDKLTGRNLSRYGSKVAELNYYKAQVNGDEHYITIYFSDDGRIADFSGY